jgi:hypothetical protein
MRITNSFPIHVARAYGVRPSAAQPMNAGDVGAAGPTARLSRPQAAGEAPQTPQGERVAKLVAGHVAGRVDFDSATRTQGQVGALQLYTRAADRVEAATGISLGRRVDLEG